MNDACEMWSLPWHALQRNLALGLGGDAPAHSAVAIKAAGATIRAVNVQSAAVYAPKTPCWARIDNREGKVMVNRYMDGDAAANLLERRWFAAFKAASGVRAECETLLESMALAQVAWSRARARLAELEAMRDALGEELEALDEREERIPAEEPDTVMSAA